MLSTTYEFSFVHWVKQNEVVSKKTYSQTKIISPFIFFFVYAGVFDHHFYPVVTVVITLILIGWKVNRLVAVT